MRADWLAANGSLGDDKVNPTEVSQRRVAGLIRQLLVAQMDITLAIETTVSLQCPEAFKMRVDAPELSWHSLQPYLSERVTRFD